MLVPASEAVTLGEKAGDPGDEAVTLGDPAEPAELTELAGTVGVPAVPGAEDAAELIGELQAVTSKAAQASATQAATCLALREFGVHMDFTLQQP